MTKAACVQKFMSSFGLAAVQEAAFPADPVARPSFPYLTWSASFDALGVEVPVSLSLWYRSEGWVAVNDKMAEISAAVGRGGVFLPCDGGGVWIRRGVPFAQQMGDPDDDMIKRMYINLVAEYITEN